MIFEYLKKQSKLKEKIKLTKIMIFNLQIPEEQKSLYIQALDILDESGIDRIYNNLVIFIKDIEIKELDQIQKNNFTVIAGMRKKEAEERKKEINSFSFLINNI
ncbi:MAG: hypothetical protein PHV23_03955 [Candidatus Gracilibacteria bacterium]|nr:hypothetical protein [Candidatus Gracilibacteria bacterium]